MKRVANGIVTAGCPEVVATTGTHARGDTMIGGSSQLLSNVPSRPENLPWPMRSSQSTWAAIDVLKVPARNSTISKRIGSANPPCRLKEENHCW